jgi:hypothetical protein
VGARGYAGPHASPSSWSSRCGPPVFGVVSWYLVLKSHSHLTSSPGLQVFTNTNVWSASPSARQGRTAGPVVVPSRTKLARGHQGSFAQVQDVGSTTSPSFHSIKDYTLIHQTLIHLGRVSDSHLLRSGRLESQSVPVGTSTPSSTQFQRQNHHQ